MGKLQEFRGFWDDSNERIHPDQCLLYDLHKFVQDKQFQESLFQVLPKGSFEIHDEFMKSHKSKHARVIKIRANQDLLDQRLKTELNQYFSFVETKIDEEVLFGQEIVLKHYDSEYFLVGSYKCSEQSMEAFQVSLSSKPSSQALFRIEAYQTYQKDGQPIYFDEPFLLVNTKQQFCLDFIENPYNGWMMKDVQRYQVIITNNSKTSWKMKLFMRNDQRIEKKSIRNYELIYLQYTEDGTYLNGEQQIVSLQQAGTHIPLAAIWELQVIQPTSDYKRNQQPQLIKEYSRGSVFQNSGDILKDFSRVAPRQRSVVDQQQQAQSQVNKKIPQQEFILRNYISGKVLTSRDQLPQLHEYIQESNQVVEILAAKQGQQEIVENSYIQMSIDKELLQNVQIEDQWNDSIKEDEELETTVIKKQLAFEEKEHQHAFQIKRSKETLKITQCLFCQLKRCSFNLF